MLLASSISLMQLRWCFNEMKELSMNYKATVDNLHSFIDQRRLFYWHSSFKHKQHYWLRSNSLKWFIYILSTTPFSSYVTLADKTAKLTADLHCGNNRCSFELSIPLKIPRQILNDPTTHCTLWSDTKISQLHKAKSCCEGLQRDCCLC